MSTTQALQSASSGTVWSRRVGGTTYFLRKLGNNYEVWTSGATDSKSPVTLSQAVTYADQYNLVPSSTPTPSPTTATKPAPAPKPEPKQTITVSRNTSPATTSFTSSTTVNSILGNTTPAPTVTSSSTITVDPTKLTNASLKDNQSIIVDPTKLTTLDPANPLKDDQSIRVDPTKLPPTETANIANLTPQQPVNAPSALPPVLGLTAGIETAAGGATAQDQANFGAATDWRVRLVLAPGSNYLYNADPPGILQPLRDSKGVIFPYTPQISVSYAATYEPAAITHTNYKVYQYQHSSVDQINITCEFTAQDVKEANYVLAVIHFFRSMTKMFYGQDDNPKNGTPPPLCYLYGMGGYQFDALPLAITGFTYSLPQDVDYIKTSGASAAGTPQPSTFNSITSAGRLGPGARPGGKGAEPNYQATPKSSGEATTWIPTKIQMAISCLPIMSRNAVSNKFSLKEYATGNLLNGTRNGATGGGFW